MMIRKIPLILVAGVFLLTGCTVKEAIDVARPTKFLPGAERLEKPKDTPFDLAWVSPDVGSWLYNTLIVQAVRTDFVDLDDWIFSAGTFVPTRGVYVDKLTDLADYTQETVAEEFKDYRHKPMELRVVKGVPFISVEPAVEQLLTPYSPMTPVESIKPKTRSLSVEISIAEANFSDPLVYGGLLAVPVPAVANLSSAVKSPSLTLEVRFTDNATGQIVWEIIDKRFPQIKVIDANRLTVSGALHEIIDSFAEDLVESFYKKADETVSRRSPVSLWPF